MPNLTVVGLDCVSAAPPEADGPEFDVVITPAQSLDTGGLRWFLVGLLAVTVVLVAILSLSHLWVAGVFVVADAAFLAIAFVACRRDLKRAERVTIDDHMVVIARFDGIEGMIMSRRRRPRCAWAWRGP